jgi:predicted acetyltransferase
MDNLRLAIPGPEHEGPWRVIVREFKDSGEKIIPYALSYGFDDYYDYLALADNFRSGNDIPSGHVPSSTFFLVGDGGEKIYGAVNIRHRLNEWLLNVGGHIGYGVAPSERRRGYATRQLALALEICRDMGLDRVLITCDKENIGSAKTILNNRGVLENEVPNADGKTVQRYWIVL